jgi:alkylation response protein AidB-like acyl-CoA dehydrogenase
LPAKALVGAENDGWRMITSQLDQERVGLAGFAGLAHGLFGEIVAWAAATDSGTGEPLIALPWVQRELAGIHARLEAVKLLSWRMTDLIDAHALTSADASGVKIFATDALVDVYRAMLAVLGPLGQLRPGTSHAALSGEVEFQARGFQVNTFAGGTNDVLREIVAARGLGMTRGSR